MKLEAFKHMMQEYAVIAARSCNVEGIEPNDIVITVDTKVRAECETRHETHPLNKGTQRETD